MVDHLRCSALFAAHADILATLQFNKKRLSRGREGLGPFLRCWHDDEGRLRCNQRAGLRFVVEGIRKENDRVRERASMRAVR